MQRAHAPGEREALLDLQLALNGLDPNAVDTEGRAGLDALLGRVGEAVQFLDTQQVLNLPSPDRESLYLQIPLLLEDQVATASLMLSPVVHGGRRQLDDATFALSLSIELSGIGRLRIALSSLHRQLACTIYAEDDRRAAFVDGMAEEARTALESCGYSVTGVSCRAFPPEEDDGATPPTVGLDVRV